VFVLSGVAQRDMYLIFQHRHAVDNRVGDLAERGVALCAAGLPVAPLYHLPCILVMGSTASLSEGPK
ncbi:hypothetical protein, partial [Pantoea sp. A4]|uniref:hypothetical protein n=1 Tax=Pantoea sp. A4 TaxID=1225184 RepID=UPI000B11FD91